MISPPGLSPGFLQISEIEFRVSNSHHVYNGDTSRGCSSSLQPFDQPGKFQAGPRGRVSHKQSSSVEMAGREMAGEQDTLRCPVA